MPTTKKRINISLSPDLDIILSRIAKRDKIPQATKAVNLLELALEIEEDAILDKLASDRDLSGAHFVTHKRALVEFRRRLRIKEYTESFKKASLDAEMKNMAEDGLKDYSNQLDILEK
jgi:hypothetical protein